MKVAVYAGSFDPITLGHLDIIRRAGEQYDRVVIAIAHNPAKKGMFTPSERVGFIAQSLGLEAVKTTLQNVAWEQTHDVDLDDGFKFSIVILPPGVGLAQCAKDIGASALIRGLRAVSDFDVEFRMALANRRLVPEIETVFLMTAQEHLFVASSTAKEVASIGGDLSTFVPPNVAEALKARLEMP